MNRRVTTGRLVRVDQRRRGRRWRIIAGTLLAAAIAVVVAFAIVYKGKRTKPAVVKVPTAETNIPARPATPATAVSVSATEQIRTAVVNATKVPQRYGNALAVLQEYNVAHGNAFTFQPYRPKIVTDEKTAILYQQGYETQARELATALGVATPPVRWDVTVICGQDVSKIILEALAKKVPAPPEVNVEVLNGAGIEGAAAKVKEQLRANGYNVVAVANAPSFDYKNTVVIAGKEHRDAAAKIAALFGLEEKRIEEQEFDVKIIIGDDFTLAPETP